MCVISKFLVIVLMIYKNGIRAFESECHAPIAIDGYCKVPGKIALQGMQLPAWHTHILRRLRLIEASQLAAQLRCMVSPNACLAVAVCWRTRLSKC
jgi:hypothetical protein